MKRAILLATAVFIAFASIVAFCVWCGGFDFNKRNSDVGFAVAFVFIMGGMLSGFAFDMIRPKP